jgi:hypothetical protein
MYIDHSIIKEYVPLALLILYLAHLKTKRLEWVFHIGILSLYSFSILFTLTHIRGYNMLGFITSNWRTWATPAMYLVFTLLTYGFAHTKTRDHPYSITLACHMTLATGYLYEAPRYLYLQGFRGLIRVSKHSPFRIHYAIISIIIIIWLLVNKKMEINPVVLFGLQQYEIYFLVFYAKYEWLQRIRFETWLHQQIVYDSLGVPHSIKVVLVPWIYLYRVPAMIMMLLAVSQIKCLDYGIE